MRDTTVDRLRLTLAFGEDVTVAVRALVARRWECGQRLRYRDGTSRRPGEAAMVRYLVESHPDIAELLAGSSIEIRGHGDKPEPEIVEPGGNPGAGSDDNGGSA